MYGSDNNDEEREMSGAVTGRIRYYRHPQGAYITVFPDGTMDVRKPDGKKKKTSATAENLASGHGAWREVDSLDPSTVLPTPEEIKAASLAAMPDDAYENPKALTSLAQAVAEVDSEDPAFHARVSNSSEHVS